MSHTARRALVTGGGRGIGRATAIALAKEGWDVAVTWKDRQGPADTVVAEIEREGRRGMALQLTLGQRASARAAAAAMVGRWGGIDLLVNNAGVLEQKPWETITDDDWDSMFASNVKGVFQLSQECFPSLREHSGSLINVSSVGGQIGGTLAMHYAASKAAIISMTRSLARLGAPKVRVNAVAPGLIETEMTAAERSNEGAAAKLQTILAGRAGTASEVADVIAFLASPKAAYVTGQIIGVNGGAYLG